MDTFINISIFIGAVWLISMGLITNAHDVLSKIVFKVIPLFIGLALLLDAVKLFGWI